MVQDGAKRCKTGAYWCKAGVVDRGKSNNKDVRGRMRATMRDAMCPRYVCVNNIALIYNNTTLAVLSNSVVRVVLTLTFRNVTLASFVSLVLISISVFSWQDGRKPIG